jgi:hypothetical protein
MGMKEMEGDLEVVLDKEGIRRGVGEEEEGGEEGDLVDLEGGISVMVLVGVAHLEEILIQNILGFKLHKLSFLRFSSQKMHSMLLNYQ